MITGYIDGAVACCLGSDGYKFVVVGYKFDDAPDSFSFSSIYFVRKVTYLYSLIEQR